jgi:hypothetical protein
VSPQESFDQTFSKVCGFQRQSLGRSSQRAKSPFGVFFFLAFSFTPFVLKEKADKRIICRYRKCTNQKNPSFR